MELFEQIRWDREREGLSIRALAERHGVHRRAVRQALVSEVPPAKRSPVSRPAPKLGEYCELIDGWLLADREAPRKQRHTAKCVWRRLVDEHGVEVAGTTVRDHVRKRRRELGLLVSEVFVPQVHAPARTAEVDWGQAEVCLAGAPTTVHLFFMRSCFSGAALSMASGRDPAGVPRRPHPRLRWFGGVFAELRYDNLTSAVKQVLKAAGGWSPIGLWRCARTTCSTRSSPRRGSGAHTRRAVWRARSDGSDAITSSPSRWSDPSLSSTRCCPTAVSRTSVAGSLGGRSRSPSSSRSSGDCCGRSPSRSTRPETAAVRVDSKALVTVRQNRYSVPVALAGMRVCAAVGATEIQISHGGRVVARHERLHGRFGTAAVLDHYLELLARKPGGLERSLPLAQERQRGSWPACFDELWAALAGRYDASQAAGQMVDVLLLCREHAPARIELAVRGALAAGAIDGRAVAVLARRAEDIAPPAGRLDDLDARLATHDRPEPDLAGYDALIGRER